MSKWISNGFEFNVGDKVRVARKVASLSDNGMGHRRQWEDCWSDEMDDGFGKEYEIEKIDISGVYFKESTYGWPLASLDKIEAACVAETKLPDGLFSLEDVFGRVYKATYRSSTYTELEYVFGIGDTVVSGSFKNTDILLAIAEGDWEIIESVHVALLKVELELMKVQQRSLNNEMVLLTAEIAKLEKEIAQ